MSSGACPRSGGLRRGRGRTRSIAVLRFGLLGRLKLARRGAPLDLVEARARVAVVGCDRYEMSSWLTRAGCAWVALVCGFSAACGPAETGSVRTQTESAESVVEQVINGQDDRRELYELESDDAHRAIANSAAALMWAHRVEFGEANAVELRAMTLASAQGVCDDQRFTTQAAAALCSASLIDDDLVLTAGHCLGTTRYEAEDRCRRLWIVFDYFMEESGNIAFDSAESVYACRRVALHTKVGAVDGFLDVAVLQLDRSASDLYTPIPLAPGRPEPGERVLAATHGAALPLKVDAGGKVLEARKDVSFFVADTDSFAGGSGGPLYNEALELIGHQVRGELDWTYEDECARAADGGTGKEEHQIAEVSRSALCQQGWPSERLCGTPGECGDGVCSARETSESCSDDCAEASCGDALCEQVEREACAGDCSAFTDVPPTWGGDPLTYYLTREPAADANATIRSARGGGCAVAPGVPRAPACWLFAALSVALMFRRLPAAPLEPASSQGHLRAKLPRSPDNGSGVGATTVVGTIDAGEHRRQHVVRNSAARRLRPRNNGERIGCGTLS